MSESPSDPITPPRQWTRADLDRATAAGDHERINAALEEGRLAQVIAEGNPEPPPNRRGATVDARSILKETP